MARTKNGTTGRRWLERGQRDEPSKRLTQRLAPMKEMGGTVRRRAQDGRRRRAAHHPIPARRIAPGKGVVRRKSAV
jgi:hypothetical protein